MGQLIVAPTFRRHPLAFSAYLMVLLIGFIFVTGWFGAGADESALFAHIHHIWIVLWEWEMLSGGVGGIITLIVRPRIHPHWPDLSDLLHTRFGPIFRLF